MPMKIDFRTSLESASHSAHAITTVADSRSSAKNVKSVRIVMADYMNRFNGSDPEISTYESSKLIVNLLTTCCKTDTDDLRRDESMGAFLQEFRLLYEEAEHRGPWTVDEDLRTAKRNPLYRNPDIEKLRSAHRFRLAKVEKDKITLRPLHFGHIAERAK